MFLNSNSIVSLKKEEEELHQLIILLKMWKQVMFQCSTNLNRMPPYGRPFFQNIAFFNIILLNITCSNLIWKMDLVFTKDKIRLILFSKKTRLVLSWKWWPIKWILSLPNTRLKPYLCLVKTRSIKFFFVQGLFLFFASRSPLSLSLSHSLAVLSPQTLAHHHLSLSHTLSHHSYPAAHHP